MTKAEAEFQSFLHFSSLSPMDVLNHPECPAEFWWEMAGFYPIEAMESPLALLLLLETPDRWCQITRDRIEFWIMDGKARLSRADLLRYEAEEESWFRKKQPYVGALDDWTKWRWQRVQEYLRGTAQ